VKVLDALVTSLLALMDQTAASDRPSVGRGLAGTDVEGLVVELAATTTLLFVLLSSDAATLIDTTEIALKTARTATARRR
jgi:hypothetical protein